MEETSTCKGAAGSPSGGSMCDRIVSGIKSMEKDLPDDEAVISFYRKQKEKRSRNDGYGRESSGEK